MKKIVVTGANGYIGRFVVKKLLDNNVNVIAVDFNLDNVDIRATKLTTDIFSDTDNIYNKLNNPDVLLHLAWRDGFIHNSYSHMLYLSDHYKFISSMLNNGLKHIAIMGTMHEIGYFEGKIDENTPCNPISMYGIAKDALRRAIFLMTKDTDIVVQWLRGFYILGDDKNNNSIFSKLILAEEENKKTFPFTTGKKQYDFISVDELSNQISACVMQNKINGIINCCSGKPISLAERTEKFISDNNFKIKLDYGVFPDRDYDSPVIYGDNSKITAVLNNYRNNFKTIIS